MSYPKHAARVVLIYTLIAALWFLLFDLALARLSTAPHVLNLLGTCRNWAFVGATAAVLYIVCRRAERPRAEQEPLAATGEQVDASAENTRLYKRLEEQALNLELLYEVGRRFSSSPEPQEALEQMARRCAQVLEADVCLVQLIEGDQLTVRASYYTDHAQRTEVEKWIRFNSVHVREGAAGQVIATGQPVVSGNLDLPPMSAEGETDDWQQSHDWLIAPLRAQDRSLGVLTLIAHHKRGGFSERDLALAQEIANQAAAALENARLYQEANQRLEEVSLIRAVALEGAAGQPFDEIIADATQRLRHVWSSYHLGFLFPDETGALRVHASYVGLPSQAHQTWRLAPGQGLTGWAFQTGQPVVVPDVRLDPRYIAISPETRSEMDAPLMVGDHAIGVINVESMRVNEFSAHDIHLLTALAGQLALLLDNAQAHRDLAERAQQLQAAFDELAEAERMKDQLVRNISHELRTPMTFLKGYVELLRDETFGPLTPDLRRPLEIVREKTSTVADLVERIVDLQAVRPDTLALGPLTLPQVIQEAVNRWEPQARQASIQLECTLPVDFPPVVGDRQRLAVALDNLLSNAIKFNRKDGQVMIGLRTEHETAHLEIADTGIGIPADKLVKIFDRFYQVDGTTRRRFGGAGVGLALVKQIVEAHGGQVWAESTGPGRGSTFHLVLPTAPSPWVERPFDSSALLVYNSVSAG